MTLDSLKLTQKKEEVSQIEFRMSWNKLTAGSWNNNAVLLWILDASISFFRIQHIEHEQYRIKLFRLIISSDDDEIDPLILRLLHIEHENHYPFVGVGEGVK